MRLGTFKPTMLPTVNRQAALVRNLQRLHRQLITSDVPKVHKRPNHKARRDLLKDSVEGTVMDFHAKFPLLITLARKGQSATPPSLNGIDLTYRMGLIHGITIALEGRGFRR